MKHDKRQLVFCLIFISVSAALIFSNAYIQYLHDNEIRREAVSQGNGSCQSSSTGSVSLAGGSDRILTTEEVFEKAYGEGVSYDTATGYSECGTIENSESGVQEGNGQSGSTEGTQGDVYGGYEEICYEAGISSQGKGYDYSYRAFTGGYNLGTGNAAVSTAGLNQLGVKTFCKAYVTFSNTQIGQKVIQKGFIPFAITMACFGINTTGLSVAEGTQAAMVQEMTTVTTQASNAVSLMSFDEMAYVTSSRVAANAANKVTVTIPELTQQVISDAQIGIETGVLPTASASTWEQALLQMVNSSGIVDTALIPGLANTGNWLCDMLGLSQTGMQGANVNAEPSTITAIGYTPLYTETPAFTNVPSGHTADEFWYQYASGNSYEMWVPVDSGSYIQISKYQEGKFWIALHDSTGNKNNYTAWNYSGTISSKWTNSNQLEVIDINSDTVWTINPNATLYFTENFYDNALKSSIASCKDGVWSGDYDSIEGAIAPLEDTSVIGYDAQFDGDGNMTDAGNVNLGSIVDGTYNPQASYQDALASVDATSADNPADETPINKGDPIHDYADDGTITGETVAERIPDVEEKTNPTGDYPEKDKEFFIFEDLTKVFPFCIPWDLYYLYGMLAAEPQAPNFVWHADFGQYVGTYDMELDLSKYDSVAKIMRVMEDIAFMVGLVYSTRNLIRG